MHRTLAVPITLMPRKRGVMKDVQALSIPRFVPQAIVSVVVLRKRGFHAIANKNVRRTILMGHKYYVLHTSHARSRISQSQTADD